jgi:hypothetical protein
VAGLCQEDAEGEETAREAVAGRAREGREGSGRKGFRTLEGSERSQEEELLCQRSNAQVGQAKTSEVSREVKDQRGSREPIRLLA